MKNFKTFIAEAHDEAKYSSAKVQKAFRSPNSYKLAKQLVNYKKNDKGLAMFRLKMHSMLQAMGADIAKTGEISKKTKKEYGYYYDGKSLDWYQKVIQQWIVEFKKNLSGSKTEEVDLDEALSEEKKVGDTVTVKGKKGKIVHITKGASKGKIAFVKFPGSKFTPDQIPLADL